MDRDGYIRAMNRLYDIDAQLASVADAWAANDPEAKRLANNGESPAYLRARGMDEALAKVAEDGIPQIGILERLKLWIASLAESFGKTGREFATWLRAADHREARSFIFQSFARLGDDKAPVARFDGDRAVYMTAYHGAKDDGAATVGSESRAPAIDQTATPEFRNWFGKSMVVDEDGNPKVMYHGTSRDFTEFDPMASAGWRRFLSMDNIGSWFSDNPQKVDQYSAPDGRQTMPVYLSIARPKVYDSFNDFLKDANEAAGRKTGLYDAPGKVDPRPLKERLKAQGYDGIAFTKTETGELMERLEVLRYKERELRDAWDRADKAERPFYESRLMETGRTIKALSEELRAGNQSTEFDDQYVWVAFEPTQIKSAIGNNGNFDPANPDIRESRTGGAEFSDDQMAALSAFLNGEPLLSLRSAEAPHQGYAKLREWAVGIFKDYGFKAINPELGEVLMDERGVRDSMGHRMSPAKAVAFKAVPDVIENGRIVHRETRGAMDSIYISAPVKIDGIDDVVTVLVHRDPNTQRFYLHSVATKESLLNHKQSGAPNESASTPGAVRAGGIERILHDILTFNQSDESRGSGAGLSAQEVDAHIATFRSFFPGASQLDIQAVQSRSDLPAGVRASPRAEGVYLDARGQIFLIADNLRDAGRVFQVLQHEVVGHYGLELMGERYARAKATVLAKARATGPVTGQEVPTDANYATVESVRKAYTDYRRGEEVLPSDDVVAAEVLARMTEVTQKPTWFKAIVAMVRQWMRDAARKFGLQVEPTMKDAEDLIQIAAHRLRKPGEGSVNIPDEDGTIRFVESLAPGRVSFSGTRPNDPVLFDGNADIAQLPAEIASRTQGRFLAKPVRLLNGRHFGKNRGYGVEHIDAEHGNDRLASATHAIEVVMNTTRIYDDGSGRLLLQSVGSPRGIAFVELRDEGGFYSVVTVFNGQPRGKLVWSGRRLRLSTQGSGDTDSSVTTTTEQSGSSSAGTDQLPSSPKQPLETLANQTNNDILPKGPGDGDGIRESRGIDSGDDSIYSDRVAHRWRLIRRPSRRIRRRIHRSSSSGTVNRWRSMPQEVAGPRSVHPRLCVAWRCRWTPMCRRTVVKLAGLTI